MSDPESPSPSTADRLRLATLARLTPADVADDAISLQLASGEIVRLNRVAADVLALCDGTRTAQEVTSACGANRDAVLDFLASARELGWVVAAGSPRG